MRLQHLISIASQPTDNAINGVPSCANDMLLTQLLRDKWRFGGYVTSDSGAIQDIWDQHHYCPTINETIGVAIRAGAPDARAPALMAAQAATWSRI